VRAAAKRRSAAEPGGLHVLFASTECAPWVKTGGLADVSAALPAALGALGHEVRVLIPAYRGLRQRLAEADAEVPLPGRHGWPEARLCRLAAHGFELWLLDCPSLYDRPGGPYVDEHGVDHADNAIRFGFLSQVAAELCDHAGPWSPWQADVLHANDWQTALAPAYLARQPAARTATMLTIHNLAFQGEFDAGWAGRLGLPQEWLNVDGVLHWERISMLKAGIRHADVITTVSPTYAREILSEEHGFSLDGMMRMRAASLHGILNGIDASIWNPRTDPLIAARYAPGQWSAKAADKAALQASCGLSVDAGPLLFGMVSRLTAQKGADLVLDNLDWLIGQGAQLVVLGSGDADLQERWQAAARSHPGRVAVHVGFDEPLAHLIEAGADCFLMPSRFEPCGLNQMYSLVYGTPPLVHATGGLADTVIDVDREPERGTGFVMQVPSVDALRDAQWRALRVFADRPAWRRLQRRGMRESFDWRASAARYAELYRQASSRRGPPAGTANATTAGKPDRCSADAKENV
jgi:starch synthase